MSCYKILQYLVTLILLHWFIGLDIVFGFLGNIFAQLFGLVGSLISFLFATIFLFFINFIPILYGIWTVIALIINIAYMVIVSLVFNYQRNNRQNKTVEYFVVMTGVCLIVPQIFNWLFFHETLRFYLILPLNLAVFFMFLDLRDPREKIKKAIVNYVLFSILLGVFG